MITRSLLSAPAHALGLPFWSIGAMRTAPPPAPPPAASAAPAGCRLCRSTPPLPRNEAPGVVRTSGALYFQPLRIACAN